MTTINTQGIDVLSGEGRMGDRDKYEPEAGEESDDVELDLSPGTLEKTNDPFACTCARWVRFRC